MKINRLVLWLFLAAIFIPSVWAQGGESSPFPVGKEAIWLALIPPITFTITWAVGKIPPLPKEVLPWITPVFGIIIGFVMNQATTANLPWWSSAGAGAIATTLYEAIKGISGAGPKSMLTPTPETHKPDIS